MNRTALEYIADVQENCDLIASWIGDKSYDEFASNDLLIPACERAITIICIALNNALAKDTELTVNLKNTGRAILYGNHLLKISSYEDPRTLWNFIQTEIPMVKKEVEKILKSQIVISSQRKMGNLQR